MTGRIRTVSILDRAADRFGQPNAPDHSESMRRAYQLCNCRISRVKFRIPTVRIKMTSIIRICLRTQRLINRVQSS
eukprot:4853611-Pyramimonas_sp.AAC.1